MTSANMLGGILSYGNHEITPIIVDGKEERSPRFFHGWSVKGWGWYALRRKGRRKYFRVMNFTHPRFAVGITTSGGLGIWGATENIMKSGSTRKGDTNTRFTGFLGFAGFWFFKFYLYIFFKGDGLG